MPQASNPQQPSALNDESAVENQSTTMVISLLSGKGGTGKTTIALSAAKFLVIVGYKVCVIDFDLSTHGATYFVLSEAQRKEQWGILDVVAHSETTPRENGEVTAKWFFETESGFDFLASKVKISAKYRNFVESHLMDLKGLLSRVVEYCRTAGYDFVFIDCQAGPEVTSFYAASLSDEVIIVSEPDPVSMGAVENLNYELISELGGDIQKHFLLNKFSIEEAEDYAKLKQYLHYWKHLPPIPFNFEVRQAFAELRVPLSVDKPGSFFKSISQVVESALPNPARAKVIEFRKTHAELFVETEVASLSKIELTLGHHQRAMTLVLTLLIGVVGFSSGLWFYLRSLAFEPVFIDRLFIAVGIPIIALFLAAIFYLRRTRPILIEAREKLSRDRSSVMERARRIVGSFLEHPIE